MEKHYIEELHDLCFWAELWHLGVWENRNVYRVLVGSIKERGSLEDMDIVGRIILRDILKKQNGVNLSGSVDRPVVESCE